MSSSVSLPEGTTIKYSDSFQEAVIGYALKDAAFYMLIRNKLQTSWFTCDVNAKTILIQIGKFFDTYGKCPISLDEFFNQTFFLSQNIAEREKYRNTALRCIESTKNHDIEIIKKMITGWLRASLLRDSANFMAMQLNQKNPDHEDVYSITVKRLKEIGDATLFDEIQTVDFNGGVEWLLQNKDDEGAYISTGAVALDKALGGGLFKGETSSIMAPSNVGKSRCLMTIMRHAVVSGYDVLYITHEDHPNRIRKRIYGAFLAMSPKQIDAALSRFEYDPANMYLEDGKTLNKIPLHMVNENQSYVNNQMQVVTDIINKHLVYLPYNKTGQMYVEDLVESIKKLQEQKKLKDGKGYDLIIDDYPKKLKSREHRGSKDGLYRAELGYVYDMFNQLAAELNTHCLVAIQTNRAGSKSNKSTDLSENDRLLGMEDIDESFAIAQNMGAIITINRSSDDKTRDILHYCVAKSRNDKNEVTVTTRTNYALGLLHGDPGLFAKVGTRMRYGLASLYREDNKKVEISTADEFLRNVELENKMLLEARDNLMKG